MEFGSDNHLLHPHAREHRSRQSLPPQFTTRASSRASNSTANTHLSGSHTSSSSSSTHNSRPQRLSQHQIPPLHPSIASLGGSADRPRSSRLSRENGENSPRTSEPPRLGSPGISSSFLQEKLQRERRIEVVRSSSRTLNDMSASAELRAVQSSPVRASTSEGRRPRSSSGADKKKGIGLKDMEETLTKLHKENFDLKFELFHRRSRQTELEDRLDALTAEVSELKESNEELRADIDVRDKAVEEAAVLIVQLEATLEALMNEQVKPMRPTPVPESDDDYGLPAPDDTDLQTPRLPPSNDDAQPSREDFFGPGGGYHHSLARMPSFVSDRSGHTENLRNVYLNANGSLLGFRKTLDDVREGDLGPYNGMSTPSLSVLSESSFLSVYGQKQATDAGSSPAPARIDSSPASDPRVASTKKRLITPTKHRRSVSGGSRNFSSTTGGSRNFSSSTFSSINHVVGGSPLQKLERLHMEGNQSPALTKVPSVSAGSGGGDGGAALYRESSFGSGGAAQDQSKTTRQRTKQEKRDALRRVMTDAPREFGNPFPPTPDTISTSTLRRYKNSNDNLSQPLAGNPTERSSLALSEATGATNASSRSPGGGSIEQDGYRLSQAPPSTSAFTSRRDELPSSVTIGRGAAAGSSYFENRLAIPSRPRSAGETSSSVDRRDANGWGSDYSDDEDGPLGPGPDEGASVSSFDPWLRESLRNRQPPHPAVGEHMFDDNDLRDGADLGDSRGGRVSPDLFSFPTSRGGWSSDAMFGNLRGQGYHGAPTAQALDALGASLPAPQAGLYGAALASPTLPSATPAGSPYVPPPPRRSSLHAQTGGSTPARNGGSSKASASPPSKLRKSPVRGSGSMTHSRANSLDANTSLAQPPQQLPPTAPEPQKRHYPPISGQPQPRRSGGLNSLFRRSLGGASDITPPQPCATAPPPETAYKSAFPPPPAQQQPVPVIGVPSRVRRDDDFARESSTPPPILRNPRGRRDSAPVFDSSSSAAAADAGFDERDGGAPLRSPALINAHPVSSASDAPVPTPTSATSAGPAAHSSNAGGGGRMRSWLGLGRVGSLRNRAS